MSDETIVPIYDPNRDWRSWHIEEIFNQSKNGKYVPNVGDLVVDWKTGFYKVINVNPSTGDSQLEKWNPETNLSENDDDLVGVDISTQPESFRVYIDTSVTPHTLACDSRLHVYGSTNTHIKIFKGTVISGEGEVISVMYSPSGDFLGENIPLELAATENLSNTTIKTPVVGYTLSDLDDGEVVTAVIYDDLGYATSYNKLLVKNTSFIRTSEASTKYVASIRLESPYLDTSDERVLKFPMNMSLEDFPAQAVVTYSDGETIRLPINDSKVKLHGLEQFISTVSGQKVPLVLSYFLGTDEYAYSGAVGEQYHISEKYWAQTTEFNESYSLKMYVYPNWVDEISGYELKFFLSNLSRGAIYDITDKVNPTTLSDTYKPLAYGSKQNLSYSVDMSKVDATYSQYKFVQAFNLTLLAPGDRDKARWVVNFINSQEIPFGNDLKASINLVNTDLSYLKIDNGFSSLEEWLRNLYYVTEPLYLPNLENRAPEPNILKIKTKRRSFEVTVNDWDTDISIINDLTNGENVYIEFIKRTFETDLKLGIIGLPVTLN